MIISSEYTPVAGKAIVELAQHNAFRVHIGVKFYNKVGDSFTEVAAPTAGSVDVKVASPVYRDLKLVGNLAVADKTSSLVNDGPVTQVQGEKNIAITGATHFKLVVVTEK